MVFAVVSRLASHSLGLNHRYDIKQIKYWDQSSCSVSSYFMTAHCLALTTQQTHSSLVPSWNNGPTYWLQVAIAGCATICTGTVESVHGETRPTDNDLKINIWRLKHTTAIQVRKLRFGYEPLMIFFIGHWYKLVAQAPNEMSNFR